MKRSKRWMIRLAQSTLVLAAACGAPDADQLGQSQAPIVNGVVTKVGQYPWMAALQARGGAVFCGASVINRRWLLTAAHCVRYGLPYRVEIGASTVNAGEAGTVRIAQENLKVHRHPKFYGSAGINDVALIEILTPLSASHKVIKLSRKVGGVAEQEPRDEMPNVRVLGYGYLAEGTGQTQKRLSQVDVPVVDQKTCAASYPGKIFDYSICAGFEDGGKDSCSGDSGGPLFSINGEEQVGIVSFGKGCARPDYYGVYMRVSSFVPWINRVTGLHL